MTMGNDKDITVLIATYNRSELLSKTLEAMTSAERDGLDVEFVIVDNNSCDNTREVVESFAGRLPVRYLFEAKAGKSCALNRALQEDVGRIIVFTDDDVIVRSDWLKAIAAGCQRWADYMVFGGKIDLIWPDKVLPGWAGNKAIHYWAFGSHDQGDSDHLYLPNNYPGGANFWIRREVLEKKPRFDGRAGPSSSECKMMGTETSFLYQLAGHGYEIMYCADVVLEHYVQPNLLSGDVIRKRAYRWGSGMPHRRICHAKLLENHPYLWRFLRLGSLVRHGINYVIAMMSLSDDKRVGRSLDVITRIGYDLESIRISYGSDNQY